jgi:hypothetical protein
MPTYAWWPNPASYSVTVLLSPYHGSVDDGSEFAFRLRGYCGGGEPLWEHEAGRMVFGEQRAIRLADLEIPAPASPHGGILELHAVRRDKGPKSGTGVIAMWVEGRAPGGGGYSIPTIPIRGGKKPIRRDDLQVVPGIVSSAEDDTELLVLNPIDEASEVHLVVSSPDGLTAESEPFTVDPWSASYGSLSEKIPRLRRLLGPSGGLGSLAIYSSHKVLPYFAYRRGEHPITCLEHPAPIFTTAGSIK